MAPKSGGRTSHNADDSALGFLYQIQYALLRIWKEVNPDAIIYLETLDDVVLSVSGQMILEQLKHSLASKPASITIASVNLWKTLRAWIDVIDEIDLDNTILNLVTVADISKSSQLHILLDESKSRESILLALREEAQRVCDEREAAEAANVSSLPHAERFKACEAFLGLSEDVQTKIISRMRLTPKQTNILKTEDELATSLNSVLAKDQSRVAALMVEWWNRQVVNAQCGKREKAIHRFEIVKRHMEIVAEIEHDNLIDYFSAENPPNTYGAHPMIESQINLVGGSKTWLQRAVTNEWRARASRARWSTENPTWTEKISQYDNRLMEEWSYKHTDMCEECEGESDEAKIAKGLEILSWSFYDAHKYMEPLSVTVVAPSYIRGTYHVLSINGSVGWHPNYFTILGFKK